MQFLKQRSILMQLNNHLLRRRHLGYFQQFHLRRRHHHRHLLQQGIRLLAFYLLLDRWKQ
jgi:hypothetical protein